MPLLFSQARHPWLASLAPKSQHIFTCWLVGRGIQLWGWRQGLQVCESVSEGQGRSGCVHWGTVMPVL